MQNLGIDNIIQAFPRLLDGFVVTIKLSAISLVLSIILGFIVGVLMTSKNKLVNIVLRVLLEAFRLIHPLIWLFVFFFGVSYVFNIQTDNMVVSIIVFTLWGTFEIGDLVRSYIESLPKSQFESSAAIGLTKIQMYRYVILPQVVIRSIPAIVNLATRLIKTTNIVFLIGVSEVLKVSQNIIQVVYYNNPNSYISFTMYFILLIVYFIICYPLSLFSKYLEKKVSVI
ncbi:MULTISPECIES: amino acid ABC transporter permease [unclassified Clostridium]|uniref:amino acid ABC transporter permease n=1 Tax=unclassified Clostridium TaxID=2614128 RepID=UPI00023B082E|nr:MULTISPECIES: amino acid ABC transporter permease [unclassified Clostridium]EHJ01659.1 polar amino acid ABC transporter, inner membrane subunit [Clostridium sp. DL-VIII]OOM78384.1 putative glutamine ABC transporter permease protein GlnP [Clostridium sp. BL-8]